MAALSWRSLRTAAAGRSCRRTSGCVQQPAHSAQEPTVSLLDLLCSPSIHTARSPGGWQDQVPQQLPRCPQPRSLPQSQGALDCQADEEDNQEGRWIVQCGLQLTCVVGRTAAPRLRLDRLLCSGVVQPATEPSGLHTTGQSGQWWRFSPAWDGRTCPYLAGVIPKKGQKGCLLGNRPSKCSTIRYHRQRDSFPRPDRLIKDLEN